MTEPTTSAASASQRQVSHVLQDAHLRAAVERAIALLTPQFGPPTKRAIAEAAAILRWALGSHAT